MARVLVVVPALNEEEALPGVIAGVRAHAPEADIIVVDDHSRDGTARVARAAGARALRLPIHLGIGGAVQTGFRYARRHGYDFVVQVDGDGQHPSAAIASLLEPLRGDRADVAIGSRFAGEAGRAGFRSTAARRLGIRLFTWLCRVVAGVTVRDATSGFRAYNVRAVRLLAHSYPADYPEVEAVVLMARAGLRIVEVPVRMRERQGGRSSISSVRALYYMVKVSLASAVTATKPRASRPGRGPGRVDRLPQ
jgi:glycosyltransferase involved in cell wall biosynthesis